MESKDDMSAGIAGAKGGKWLAVAALFANVVWAHAQQSSEAATSKAVALVSDACPAVQSGGRIGLDWNPDFDQAGEVSALGLFNLTFRKLDQDGVNLMEPGPMFTASTLHTVRAFTPLGNGFYHIEVSIPKNVQWGVYRLVAAYARAEVYPEYKDTLPWPSMTDSPVRARFCVTVVRPEASQPTPTGD